MKQRKPPGFTPLQFLPLPDQHRHHYNEKINIKNCHDSARLPDAGGPVERPGLDKPGIEAKQAAMIASPLADRSFGTIIT